MYAVVMGDTDVTIITIPVSFSIAWTLQCYIAVNDDTKSYQELEHLVLTVQCAHYVTRAMSNTSTAKTVKTYKFIIYLW